MILARSNHFMSRKVANEYSLKYWKGKQRILLTIYSVYNIEGGEVKFCKMKLTQRKILKVSYLNPQLRLQTQQSQLGKTVINEVKLRKDGMNKLLPRRWRLLEFDRLPASYTTWLLKNPLIRQSCKTGSIKPVPIKPQK